MATSLQQNMRFSFVIMPLVYSYGRIVHARPSVCLSIRPEPLLCNR